MGIPLRQGRVFNAQDRDGAPGVAVVKRKFARRHLIGSEADRRRLSPARRAGSVSRIVGVVPDGKYGTVGESPQPFLYCR